MPRRNRKRKLADPREAGDLPTAEQLAHGTYERGFVTHAEQNTKSMAHRNLRDPILRWEKDRKITDMQASTIRRMQALWHAVYGTQRLTATYDEPVAGTTGHSSDARQLERRDELRRIEGHFAGVLGWYQTFERVCRFGLTGPDACVSDSVTERAARERALVIVCFVADFIAAREGW